MLPLGNNIVAFFSASYARVHGRIKLLGVIADSGFYLKQFIEALEGEKAHDHCRAAHQASAKRDLRTHELGRDGPGAYGFQSFPSCIRDGEKERRYVVVRQDIIRRTKAMGKTLPLFAHEVDVRDYRFSAWITNSPEPPYEVWTRCKPRANDENTIKELKQDFALGGFSMKSFYSVEAAMVLRVLLYNLFLLFKQQFLGRKKRATAQDSPVQVLCAPRPDGK